MNTPGDNVELFLRTVGDRLPGPGRLREEILAALRDGLHEAAEANERAGLPPAEAIRRAVKEFGHPEPLAASFRPELMAERGRRTALALLAVTPVVLALWVAAARSRETIGPSRLFDSPADHIAAGVLVAAVIASGLLTLVTTGRASRWLRLTPLLSLLGATTMGALTIVANVAAVSVLTARLAGLPGTLHKLVLAAAIAASCASAVLGLRAGWSCLTMTRAGRTAAPEP
jgi:hypothetical protein